MKIIEPDPRPELLCKFCGRPLAKEPQQRTLDGTEGWHIDCSLAAHNNSPIPRAAVEAVINELRIFHDQNISYSDTNSLAGYHVTAIELNARALAYHHAIRCLQALLDQEANE